MSWHASSKGAGVAHANVQCTCMPLLALAHSPRRCDQEKVVDRLNNGWMLHGGSLYM